MCAVFPLLLRSRPFCLMAFIYTLTYKRTLEHFFCSCDDADDDALISACLFLCIVMYYFAVCARPGVMERRFSARAQHHTHTLTHSRIMCTHKWVGPVDFYYCWLAPDRAAHQKKANRGGNKNAHQTRSARNI